MKHPKPQSDNVDEYLEEMYRCELAGRRISTLGLANAMDISMPSVSQMLAKLRERGLASYEPRGDIALTSRGRAKGKDVYEKHAIVKRFLLSLGMSEKKAEDEACRLEHAVSGEVAAAMARFARAKLVNRS